MSNLELIYNIAKRAYWTNHQCNHDNCCVTCREQKRDEEVLDLEFKLSNIAHHALEQKKREADKK